MNREEAKAKVAKLMAMGHSTTANENEAETALRHAAWLMRQHNIEEAEVELAQGSETHWEWIEVSVPLDNRFVANAISWLGEVALGIARFTDTRVEYRGNETFGVVLCFRGVVSDVTFAVYLCKHLRDTIRTMSGNFMGDRSQREDFRRGMVNRLVDRMRQLKAENARAARADASASGQRALVIVDRKLAALTAQYGDQSQRRSKRRSASASAAAAGASAANRVGLGRPLTGPAAQRAIGA